MYVRDARGRFKSSTANTTPKDKGRLWGAWPGGSTIYDIYFTRLVSCLDSYWDKIKYFLAQPSHHQGRGSWLLSDGLMGRGKGFTKNRRTKKLSLKPTKMASQDPNRSSSRNYVRDARGRFKSSTATTTPEVFGDQRPELERTPSSNRSLP